MKKTKIIFIAIGLYCMLAVAISLKDFVHAKERVINRVGANTSDMPKNNKEYQREELRSFYSAPPVVPHEVESRDARSCLQCHQQVTHLKDGRVAMPTPHPEFSNCLQCHVPSSSHQDEVDTDWKGLEEPQRGDRWFWTSPPTIPHQTRLRKNCLSCHGPDNPNTKLRTTHPERSSCLQCHVPSYNKEF